MSYGVRLATSVDLPLLAAVERAASARFRDLGLLDETALAVTMPDEVLAAYVDAGCVWVATTADDRPIGFAVATALGGNAHLVELDVVPDHGRLGLGRRLVDAVVAWGRARGFPALTLSTFRDVPWNAPYYARLGFRVLADAELTPALRELRREEARHGLCAALRVCMLRPLPPAA